MRGGSRLKPGFSGNLWANKKQPLQGGGLFMENVENSIGARKGGLLIGWPLQTGFTVYRLVQYCSYIMSWVRIPLLNFFPNYLIIFMRGILLCSHPCFPKQYHAYSCYSSHVHRTTLSISSHESLYYVYAYLVLKYIIRFLHSIRHARMNIC